MMKSLRNTMRMIGQYFRVNLSASLEYRESFYMSAFGMLLSNSSFVFFWWIAFDQIGGSIGGYDFCDVMFLWASCSSAYGLCHIVFGNVNRLRRLIVGGGLDTFLLQPKDVLVNVLCAGTNFSAWGDLAYGFVLMALTGQELHGWIFFAVAVVFGSLLIAATSVAAHSLAFFFGDSSVVGELASSLVIDLSIYPEGIFRGFLRFVMYSIIPSAFIVHIPLRLARGGSPWWLAAMATATFLYCLAAYRFFMAGLKRYESGNLIVTRV
jgi:ABC-2 type transport system permease protein